MSRITDYGRMVRDYRAKLLTVRRMSWTGGNRFREGCSLQEFLMDADVVFDQVRRIPVGFVTTYGALTPSAPRRAGRLLSQAPAGIPWWRVVRSDGSLAKGSEQQRLLMAEGVPMRGARVIMKEAFIPADILM